MSFDEKSLWNISYGLYVIGAKYEGRVNAQIANTVFQVSNEPPSVAVSISKNCFTHDLILKSRAFSVSILEQETPMEFIGNFGFRCGKEYNKFEKVGYEVGVTGSPVVKEHAISILEVKLTGHFDTGTHTIFVGNVVFGEVLNNKESLTYAYYQNVKKGKAHKNAPTFKGDVVNIQKKEIKMQKYVCKVCGYVYDPEKGDPDGGVKPGTKFEDIPDSWVCPVCGVGKDQFEPE